jgi:hypothetical protein
MAFFGCRLLVQVGNRCLVPGKKYRNKCPVKFFFICLNKSSGEQATEFYGSQVLEISRGTQVQICPHT